MQMTRVKFKLCLLWGAAVPLSVLSSVLIVIQLTARLPRDPRIEPATRMVQINATAESTSKNVESIGAKAHVIRVNTETIRAKAVTIRTKSESIRAKTEMVDAKATRLDTLKRMLSDVVSANKFIQLMRSESFENEVLPESTVVNHSICTKNDTFTTCKRAVAWSHQSILGDGCENLFLDVGSNIGIHARFLFEPELYRPRHVYDDVFDNEFGAHRTHDREKICVLAFEPNPAHRQRHQDLETAYARQGWRYRAFYAAVRGGSWESRGHDKLVFYRNDGHANNDWGFSVGTMHSEKARIEKIEVTTIDISQFVIEHVANAATRPKRVLMKMDIEGSEYAVLPHMLANNAFRYIDAITAEFHHWSRGFQFIKGTLHISQVESIKFSNIFSYLLKAVYNTTFRSVDDESFLFDGKKFPI